MNARSPSWRTTVLPLALIGALAVAGISCGPRKEPAQKWAHEQTFNQEAAQAVLRVSRLELVPGQTVELELSVHTVPGQAWMLPELDLPGLEPVQVTDLPARLDAENRLLTVKRWVFQAGPPGILRDIKAEVILQQQGKESALGVPLPELRIISAFAAGSFTNALPRPDALPGEKGDGHAS